MQLVLSKMPKSQTVCSQNFLQRVALFGHFDGTNFGNESTLQAIIYQLRSINPNVEITCISTGHEAASANYGIQSVPISYNEARASGGSVFVKAVRSLPSELYGLVRGFRTLSRMQMLIVPGTGLLTDAYGLRGWGPFNSCKWSILAKICGCKLAFVSVGAGPFYSFLGRFFIKTALSLADFRSYRDELSRRCLKSIGFRVDEDPVYPDLAFSLPNSMFSPHTADNNKRPVIGIGMMIYAERYSCAEPSPKVQNNYINILVQFANWLIATENDVRLLVGDLSDLDTKHELKERLKEVIEGNNTSHIIDDPILSVEGLLSQITTAEIIVATRFHNILLALLCNKPVIAISFHHKCHSLMAAFGLSEYCLDLESINFEMLIEKFCKLRQNASVLKAGIREKAGRLRQELDDQYDIIFKRTSI